MGCAASELPLTTGRADLVLLAANVVYGTAYVAQRIALDDVPPATLALLRLALAGALLWPYLRRSPSAFALAGDGLKILGMGVLGFGAAYVLSHAGLRGSTATNAALLVAMEPIAVMLLSPAMLGERLRRREGLGAALVLVGAVAVVLDGVPGVTVALLPHWRGDLLLALSALAFASYSLLGRDVLRRWDSRTVTARSIVWGLASMVPLAALEWVGGERPAWTVAGTTATLYLAVVVTGLAYLAWNYALTRVSAPRAAIFINVQPVVGVGLGVLMLGERATIFTVAGAVLVVAGLLVTAAPGGD